MTTTSTNPVHSAAPRRPAAGWLAATLGLIALAVLLGVVSEPPARQDGPVSARAPLSVQDWRGNSARLEPMAAPAP